MPARTGAAGGEGRAVGAAAAAERLARAARRSFARGDVHAAAGLFARAVALLPAAEPSRRSLLPSLAEMLMEQGDLARAREVPPGAEVLAAHAGDAIEAIAAAEALSVAKGDRASATRAAAQRQRLARSP